MQRKHIEISDLSNPQNCFTALENDFIDVMYPDQIIGNSLIAFLDVNLDPEKQNDLNWLEILLNESLNQINEKDFLVKPFSKND